MLPDFRRGNLVTIPRCTSEALLRPHPFWIQTSKPNSVKTLKANANSLFLIADVWKLKFYQNKGLSLDKRCGVPNNFPTHNQTSELKNQDFLSIHIRLGKTTFFLTYDW